MKALSWLKYFVYLLLIILTVWINGAAIVAVQADYSTTGKMNYLLYLIIMVLPVIVGVAIGAEVFVKELSKKGKWRLNLPKLILLALPALYFSAFYFIAMIPNRTVYNIFIAPAYKFFGGSTTFIILFQLALGYFLITMFYKADAVCEAVTSDQQPEVDVSESEVDSEAVKEAEPKVVTDSEPSETREDAEDSEAEQK